MAISLSQGLEKLLHDPLAEQAKYWREVALSLGPHEQLVPETRGFDAAWSDRNAATLGVRDVLGRYFDATLLGLREVFDYEAKGAEQIDREGFCRILSKHFGFQNASVENINFQKLCDVVMGSDANSTATLINFRHATCRLRLGALLNANLENDGLVFYDYDRDSVHASFAQKTALARRNQSQINEVSHEGYSPNQQSQEHCHGDIGCRKDCLEEFLLMSPFRHPGRVHWVHAQRPGSGLLLALGQLYHLEINVQGALVRLDSAQTQMDLCRTIQPESPLQADARVDVNFEFSWSMLIFPAVCLDQESRSSLEAYRAWFRGQFHTMRQKNESANMKHGDEHLLEDAKGVLPPPIHVAVVCINLAVLWSQPMANGGGTLITVTSAPEYVGKWQSKISDAKGFWKTLFGYAWNTSSDDVARRDGYEPVVQDPEEAEKIATQAIKSVSGQEELEAQAEATTSFDVMFDDVMGQILENNSVLRRGSHLQLMCRILVSRAAEYLDVVQVYTIAISRLQTLLGDRHQPAKHELIAKVAQAKLELNALLRMVEPFVETVLPGLRERVLDGAGVDAWSRGIARHHMSDIGLSLRELMQKLKAQIQICESLIAGYDRLAADKVNNVLTILTFITFLVMPTQLLTGLYGMNFRHMPELDWKHGYHFFFFMSSSGTILCAWILYWVYRQAT